MATIIAYAQFIKSKIGVNSLTVTWDVDRITRSDGTRAALVTGAATNVTIGRRGLYGYRLTDADITVYDYVFTAITAGDVDRQELAALWTLYSLSWHDIQTSIMTAAGSIGKRLADYIDALISSRADKADYTPARAAKLDYLTSESGVDPLDSVVPGDYASGTAGAALGKIGTGVISTVSPVAQDGSVNTWQYDSYAAADGRALDWTDDDDTWPTLTGATISVIIDRIASFSGSVVTATGTGKKVRLELTTTQSASIQAGGFDFQVIATVDGKPWTLIDSQWTSHRRYTVVS